MLLFAGEPGDSETAFRLIKTVDKAGRRCLPLGYLLRKPNGRISVCGHQIGYGSKRQIEPALYSRRALSQRLTFNPALWRQCL